MQRWVLSSGSLNNLRLEEQPIPQALGRGEVLVKVENIGLNFADVFACLGLYSATPKEEFTPGLEFAGIVEAIGEGSDDRSDTTFQKGDRVMGVTRFGAYATHVVVTSSYLRPVPESWSSQQAASFLCQALTAWYGLVELGSLNPPASSPSRVQKALGPKVVLIQSAAGGVGLWALNVCTMCDAIAIAVVGNESKRQFLIQEKGMSPELVLVRATGALFAAQLKDALSFISSLPRLEGKKVDGISVVFDAVAGDYFYPSYQAMARGGKYVIYGAAQYMSSCGDSPNWIR